MSPFQAAVRSHQPNGVIKKLKTMKHYDRVRAVQNLPPQCLPPRVGTLFRALGLHRVTLMSRQRFGIALTLSPLAALLDLLCIDGIDVHNLLSLFRDALHRGLPLAPPREIGPLTYYHRGYRPGPHYIWTRRATFQLRRAPLPPYTDYTTIVGDALRAIPCAETRALLVASTRPWRPNGAPAYKDRMFFALRACTLQTLPLELVYLIMSLVPPDVDYSVASILIQ